jgi:hypothetical protein
VIDAVPPSVVAAAAGAGTVVTGCTVEPVNGGSGVAASVQRLVFRAGARSFTVIKKTGSHRELLAYESGLLPSGPGLKAPRLLGIDGDAIFLAAADGPAETPEVAAERLARWQAGSDLPRALPLTGHQLAERELDWSAVDADPALSAIWDRRHDLLEALGMVPSVLSHGDFRPGNLIAAGGDTVALDWGAFGIAPVGADLAHLALGTLRDQLPFYLKGSGGRFAIGDVILGYRVTLALTGAARAHRMLTDGVPLPSDYVRFVKVQAVAIPW